MPTANTSRPEDIWVPTRGALRPVVQAGGSSGIVVHLELRIATSAKVSRYYTNWSGNVMLSCA